MKRDDAISMLLDLVKVCRSNRHRNEMAAVSTADYQLAALFRHYAMQREKYAVQLGDIVRNMGGYLDNVNGASLTQGRAQPDVEFLLEPENGWATIAECERGEAQALRCYIECLGTALPKQVLHVLEHQYEQTRITYANISNLRDGTRFYLYLIKKLRAEYRNGKQAETLQPLPFTSLEQ